MRMQDLAIYADEYLADVRHDIQAGDYTKATLAALELASVCEQMERITRDSAQTAARDTEAVA